MTGNATLFRRREPHERGAAHGVPRLRVLLCLLAAPASAADTQDKFHITAQEKAACASDAIRLCLHTYPDEDQLLACMKERREALTTGCRVAFDAGVKRRRL